MTARPDLDYMIRLVRISLMRARRCKQEYEVHGDMARYDNIFATPERNLANSAYAKARFYRMQAKSIMELVENENGRRFIRGEPTFPLKDCVNGRSFSNWPEYAPEFGHKGRIIQEDIWL